MNKAYLIIAILLTSLNNISYSQCDFESHDSIRTSKDWTTIKNYFFPADLDQYPLIFEKLNEKQVDSLSSLLWINYYIKLDSITSIECDYKYGNCFFGIQEVIHKRFNKHHTKNHLIVNIDSIKNLPVEKYPYVLMFYTEVISTFVDKKTGEIWPLTSRCGYYIWDRRNNNKYPVYSCIGRKEDKTLFKLLSE